VNRAFSALCQDRHYVLGNHCVDTLNKQEFLGGVDREKSYYSFRRQGWHFIVLDACFRSDGVAYQRRNFDWKDANISAEELEWLTADLQQGKEPVIVFAHQRLDVADAHGVRNAPDVRRILERSGRVRAVFQGHSHQNDLKLLEGIPYCTLVAMVEGDGLESSGYSVLECMGNESLRLQGFRRQTSRHWGSVSD
jgi:alkaline phosphatase